VSLVATGALVAPGALLANVSERRAPDPMIVGGAAAAAEDVAGNPLGMAEWRYAQRVFPENTIPYDAVAEANALSAQMSQEALARTDGAAAARWKLTGPSNIGGRIRELAVDPTHPGHVYIAAAAGGIWKTTNSGQTFAPAWPDSFVQAMGR